MRNHAVRTAAPGRMQSSPGFFRQAILYGLALPILLIYTAGHVQAETLNAPLLSACEIDYPPFCIVDDAGEAGGFSIELMRAALAAMDHEVTFRTGSWPEVRGWLEQGELEALPLVGRTPERELLFDFTVPYMTLHGTIVYREETTDIRRLNDLRGRRVAVMKGDNAEEFLRREDRGIDIVTTPTFEIALQQLSNGLCDAVVMQRLVALRLIQQAGLKNLRLIDRPLRGFSQDFCFAVKEGDRDTLALLNEGLALVMADGTYRHLHAKWFAGLELPTDRPIVVGGDHNYPPFEFLDEQGRPSGYNVDLTRAIAREMGFDIEIRLGPWAEIVKGLEDGSIDIMQGMFYLPGRDLRFNFSQPHAINSYVGVARADEDAPPSSLEDLAGKKVVIQRGDAIHDHFEEIGASGQFTFVETQEDVLRELSEGKHDFAVVTRVSALYLIEKEGWDNLVLGRTPFLSLEYCYVTRNDRNALLAQFSEGLKVLEATGEYRRIYDKWLGVYRDQTLPLIVALRYLAMLLLPLLLILLAISLWSWSLRRQVTAKTRELRESLDRFQYIFESANVGKSLTLPTGEIESNKAFADYLGYTREELNTKKWQDITPPEDVQATQEIVLSMLDGNVASARFEKRYVRKDGAYVWADVNLSLRRAPDGKPLYFVITIVDITARKQAEAILRESEERFRLMLETLPAGVFVHDLEGNFLFVNEMALKNTGFSRQELLGMNVRDIDPDSMIRGDQEYLWKDLRKANPVAIQSMHKRKDGSEYPADIFLNALILDGKKVILALAFDVTERKQTEQHNDLLLSIIRQCNDFIGIANSDQYVTYLNPAGITMVGLDDEKDVQETKIEEYFLAEDVVYLKEVILPALMKEGRWSGEFRFRNFKTGKAIPVNYDLFLTDDPLTGDVMNIATITRDITRQKEAEEALRESQSRLAMTIDGAQLGTFDWDLAQDHIIWNRRHAELFGLALEDFDGKYSSFERCVHSEDIAPLNNALRKCQQDRALFRHEFRIVWPDGSLHWISGSGNFIYDELTGNALKMYGVVADITERKEAEGEKLDLELQLQQAQKLESVGRLAGCVAHDFNNMLGVILGHTELIIGQIDPGNPLRDDLDEIRKAAERSAGLTRQLLAFARKQTVVPRALDLNETIEGMLNMLRRMIGEEISLVWLPESHLWPVYMDASQIDQMLANLCVNARDAIGGIGKIVIETRNCTFNNDYCATHADCAPGDFVLLGVSDTGCGIAKENLNILFDPFFTTKELGKGTGLGLATVYGIVKQNNGFIHVCSEPGQGAIFNIYLPRHTPERTAFDMPVPKETPGGNETILVVEDEPAILAVASTMLTRMGYSVLKAGSPGEAIRLAGECTGKIDLLITDVIMPEMNGRDLAQTLMSLHPGLKCLFMSGYTADVIAHHGILDPGVHFIQKPFMMREIADKVREVIAHERPPISQQP